MLNSESPFAVFAQAVVFAALIALAGWLAYIDPGARPGLEATVGVSIGGAAVFFFTQRAQAQGGAQAMNGMTHVATLIAAATPGPTGPIGPKGPSGTPAAVPADGQQQA
jgi:hypothetical protein